MSKCGLVAVSLVFSSVMAWSQTGSLSSKVSSPCSPDVHTATNAVREHIFREDPLFKDNVVDTEGYLRISVYPHSEDEVFYQIRLVGGMNADKSVVVKYSIPKNTKYLAKAVEKALKSKPCATVPQLAASLKIKRTVIEFRKEWRPMFEELYQLNFRARPYLDEVWLDRTQFELEYVGTNHVHLESEDYDDPAVKWIITLLNTIDSGTSTGQKQNTPTARTEN